LIHFYKRFVKRCNKNGSTQLSGNLFAWPKLDATPEVYTGDANGEDAG